MKNLITLCMVLLLGIACSSSQSSGKVLAEVNGNKITEGDIEFLGSVNPRIQAQLANPVGRQKIVDNLIDQSILYQQALKKGINRSPKVKAKIDLYRRVIISQAYLDLEVENAAKSEYDSKPDNYTKVGFSHIMIKYASEEKNKKGKEAAGSTRTEAAALKEIQAIKTRIDGGESFEKLAKELSEDKTTSRRGGKLGKSAKSERRLVSRGYGPLLEKAFELPVGKVSGAIKTSKGYHLVVVTDGVEIQPFTEIKERIMFQLTEKTRNRVLKDLKKEANIVYPEKEAKKTPSKEAGAHKEGDGHQH